MSTDQHSVRHHILATGQAIITGKGYSAVGLNEILAAAGVPKGSFYHYFKSKEMFGQALLEEYVRAYLAELEALLAPDGSPAAVRLLRYWNSWLTQSDDGCAGSKCLVVKLSGEVADMSEAMRAVLLRGTNDIVRRVGNCIADGVADGSIPPGPEPQQCALALYQMWLGAALLTKLRREPSALEGALHATRALLRLPEPGPA